MPRLPSSVQQKQKPPQRQSQHQPSPAKRNDQARLRRLLSAARDDRSASMLRCMLSAQPRRLLAGLPSPSSPALRLTAILSFGPPAPPSAASPPTAGEKLLTGAKPARRGAPADEDEGSGVPLAPRGESGSGRGRIGMSEMTDWTLAPDPDGVALRLLRVVGGVGTTGLPLPLTFFSSLETPPSVSSWIGAELQREDGQLCVQQPGRVESSLVIAHTEDHGRRARRCRAGGERGGGRKRRVASGHGGLLALVLDLLQALLLLHRARAMAVEIVVELLPRLHSRKWVSPRTRRRASR